MKTLYTQIQTTMLLLLLAVAVVGVAGCVSPLDSGANRIETPVTPAIKITPSEITASFRTATAEFALKALPVFRVDTTTKPYATVWMDYTLEHQPDADAPPALRSFRVRADSLTADGVNIAFTSGEVDMFIYVPSSNSIERFPSDVSNNTANMIISQHKREAGKPLEITITLYMIVNKSLITPSVNQETILGTIHMVL